MRRVTQVFYVTTSGTNTYTYKTRMIIKRNQMISWDKIQQSKQNQYDYAFKIGDKLKKQR